MDELLASNAKFKPDLLFTSCVLNCRFRVDKGFLDRGSKVGLGFGGLIVEGVSEGLEIELRLLLGRIKIEKRNVALGEGGINNKGD